jgi:hypothetical protein
LGRSNAVVDWEVGTLLMGNAQTSTDGVDFHSHQASDSAERPRLIVTFSP